MAASIDQSIFEYLLRLGDNCLILSHRVSEWCGHGPALEEDIALANIALDHLGQAQLWYGLACELENQGRSADDLAFTRDAAEFRNLLLVERPNGDFGQTLVRQFMFDAWYFPTLMGLETSKNRGISEIAQKTSREVAYHLDRSRDLVIRLGDGTAESHKRMQAALNDIWPFCGEMHQSDTTDAQLVAAGIIPDAAKIQKVWAADVDSTLATATLTKPDTDHVQSGGKQGIHTEHMGYLLAEMQFMQRAYPGSQW